MAAGWKAQNGIVLRAKHFHSRYKPVPPSRHRNVAMAHSFIYEPYLWVPVYELAVAEKNSGCRHYLLLQAREALLERAQGLEETQGSDLECAALEAAATVIGDLITRRAPRAHPVAFAIDPLGAHNGAKH